MRKQLCYLMSVGYMAVFALAGCSSGDHGHDHDHADHADQASSHEFEHLEDGQIVLSRDLAVGTYRLEVIQGEPFDPAREDFMVTFRFLGEETADVVRMQIRNPDGSTSANDAAHSHGETLMVLITELPEGITGESELVIEIEDADGNVATEAIHIHVH